MEAWEKFRSFVSENNLVSAGDRVILAVSGGPDSVCLAHLFWRLKKTLPLELMIVNMDHGLRKESSRESRKVEALGKKLGIPVIVRGIKVRQASGPGKDSLETAGRNLRYELLFKLAKQTGFNKIATGHNANDNAETVLMWLIRGAGTDGLSGIPAARSGRGPARIIRPILSVTREEIMSYIRAQKLPYSTDSSNLTLDFTRNRIRHKVVPLLEGFNPRLVEHIFNLSRIVGKDNEMIGDMARGALKRIAKAAKNRISLDLKGFFRYNEAVKFRIIKEILPEKVSLSSIRRVYALAASKNRKEIILSKVWRVEKRGSKIMFSKSRTTGSL